MSTTQFSPQLRPLSVGEVLDASFKIVRQSFGTLAGCVLVVALPLNIINTLIAASTSDNAFNLDSDTEANDIGTGTELAGTLLTTTLSLVLTTLATAACFRAVSGIYLGERPTVGGSLSFAATRLLPLIGLSFLYFVGLIPAFLALIIPGVWLAVAWSVSFPALLSEDLGPVAALRRSFRLVRGRWWPTFGALVVMYLLVIVISGILGALLGATLIAAVDSEPVAAVFSTIVNTLASLITLPLMAAVLTVLYFDLRVRKEGFDLQRLARGVGQETSAGDASPQSVGAASGLGGAGSSPREPSGGFAPPVPPASERSGGFAPPRPPDGPDAPASSPPRTPNGPDAPASSPPRTPDGPDAPRSAPPPSGGLRSGDPLEGPDPPERREGGGGPAS